MLFRSLTGAIPAALPDAATPIALAASRAVEAASAARRVPPPGPGRPQASRETAGPPSAPEPGDGDDHPSPAPAPGRPGLPAVRQFPVSAPAPGPAARPPADQAFAGPPAAGPEPPVTGTARPDEAPGAWRLPALAAPPADTAV